jgi:hypothetical protein
MNKLKLFLLCAAVALAGFLPAHAENAPTNTTPALALVVIYDGSGSMREDVKDSQGKHSAKYLVANNAVNVIARKIDDYIAAKQIDIDAALIYFKDGFIKTGVPMQTFKAQSFTAWAAGFNRPSGDTPIGNAINAARKELEKSKALKKHILIITDGANTAGPAPETVVADMNAKKEPVSVYFVAFDVSASVFSGVKNKGALVVSAADAGQLNMQIDMLLGKKILLEAE